MNNPLISIIVPCYKVEQYLPKCVDSIISQSYKNLEIWLVDDGSPDKCGQICDEFAKKDRRVKVIHKENGGLSDARNVALDIISGDYVFFVDSDDYLEIDAINLLCTNALKCDADIVVGNYNFVYEFSNVYKKAFAINEIIELNRDEALKSLLYQKKMETSAWGKLYRKCLFDDIRFPKGKLFEDICTTYKTFLHSEKIVLLPNVVYNYLIRKNSIMGNKFSPSKMDAVYMSKEMLNGISQLDKKDLSRAATCRYLSMCFNVLFQTEENSLFESYIWKEIRKYRKIVIHDFRARKRTIIASIISFGGVRFLRFVNKTPSYLGLTNKWNKV